MSTNAIRIEHSTRAGAPATDQFTEEVLPAPETLFIDDQSGVVTPILDTDLMLLGKPTLDANIQVAITHINTTRDNNGRPLAYPIHDLIRSRNQ